MNVIKRSPDKGQKMSTKLTNKAVAIFLGICFSLALVASTGLIVEDGKFTQKVFVLQKVRPAAVIDQASIPADTVTKEVKLRTTVTDLDAKADAWLMAWRLPSLVIVFTLVFLAIRFVALLAQGQQFAASNVVRLRAMAVLLMLSPVVKLFTDHARRQLLQYSPIANVPFPPITFSPGPFLVGLAVMLVAEAFAAGGKAEKEVEGLV